MTENNEFAWNFPKHGAMYFENLEEYDRVGRYRFMFKELMTQEKKDGSFIVFFQANSLPEPEWNGLVKFGVVNIPLSNAYDTKGPVSSVYVPTWVKDDRVVL